MDSHSVDGHGHCYIRTLLYSNLASVVGFSLDSSGVDSGARSVGGLSRCSVAPCLLRPSPGPAWAMFDSLEDLSVKLSATGYFLDRTMTQVIFLAAKLKKPLLLEGPAASMKVSNGFT